MDESPSKIRHDPSQDGNNILHNFIVPPKPSSSAQNRELQFMASSPTPRTPSCQKCPKTTKPNTANSNNEQNNNPFPLMFGAEMLLEQHRLMTEATRRPDATCKDFKTLLKFRLQLVASRLLPADAFVEGLPPKVMENVRQFHAGLKWAVEEENHEDKQQATEEQDEQEDKEVHEEEEPQIEDEHVAGQQQQNEEVQEEEEPQVEDVPGVEQQQQHEEVLDETQRIDDQQQAGNGHQVEDEHVEEQQQTQDITGEGRLIVAEEESASEQQQNEEGQQKEGQEKEANRSSILEPDEVAQNGDPPDDMEIVDSWNDEDLAEEEVETEESPEEEFDDQSAVIKMGMDFDDELLQQQQFSYFNQGDEELFSDLV